MTVCQQLHTWGLGGESARRRSILLDCARSEVCLFHSWHAWSRMDGLIAA